MSQEEFLNFACFEFVEEINQQSDRDMIIIESKILHPAEDEYIRQYTVLATKLFKVQAAMVLVALDEAVHMISLSSDDEQDPSSFKSLTHSIDVNSLVKDESADVVVFEEFPSQMTAYRFLAMAAIVMDEIKIGFLTIVDLYPRHDFSSDDRANLRALAGSLGYLISERRKVHLLKETNER